MFPTRDKSAPGWGVAAGRGPTLRPRRTRGRESRPTARESRAPPLAPAYGLGVRVPEPSPSCLSPNSPLARSDSEGGARAPRSKPAPALEQTFQLEVVPTTSEPGAPAGARVAGRPRADTNRFPAGSGPEPPGWVAACQRSTVEKQVELHDWGGAGCRPGGADPRAERPAAARTKRRRSGLRCHSPPGQPPGAAVSPQDRPQGVKLGLCLRWTLHR